MQSPILKSEDFSTNEPVWVITDSSKTGISAMYGQGKDWDKCQPAGFVSKKFMSTQYNYCMHEHNTIAVLKALMKWEDKLLGRKFTVVTDHKGLEYFKTQLNLLPRQTRWLLDLESPMDLQQSPSRTTPSLLYLLHPQVCSISVTSPTPLHSSLFPLVSSFIPASLFH